MKETRAEKKARIEEMRRICQPDKTMEEAIASDRLIYRRIGFLFTRVFVKTNITPNQITWVWGALMMIFSSLFLFHDYWYSLIGAVGWILAFAMDNTDGEVARFKKMTSKRGLFLDLVNHSVTLPFLFFCIGTGVFLQTGMFRFPIFGFIAGVGMLLIMVMPELFNSVGVDDGLSRGNSLEVEGTTMKHYKLIRDLNPLSFLNMFFVLLFFAAINRLDIFLYLYAAGYMAGCIFRFAILYRKLEPARKS